jgi:nucleoside phosphorylase
MSLSHRDYTVACICPMGVELAPVKAMLDRLHPSLPTQRDQNSYTLGEMEGHNIVIAVLPEIGTNSAATVAIQLLNDFPSIRFGLLVGIGGGVPDEEEDGNDIRLGDVVVSKPTASFGGVVQYDLGKYSTGGGFERTGVLAKPPLLLRASVETLAADHRMKGSRVPQYLLEMLQRFPAMEEEYSHPDAQQDQLFQTDYPHPSGPNCLNCDKQRIVARDNRRNKSPKFHYGTIGSANTVVKDARLREELRRALKIICVEMEAAGLMDSFPCLVIRGICDYADSHKNKKWQPYAAATAAAYMKELLSVIPPNDVVKVSPATDVVRVPSEYTRNLLTH